MATIKEISEKANVSIATPSYAISKSGLTEKMYTRIEKRLLKRYLISTDVYDITVNVVISYDSPKGKKHRSKSKIFDYDSVIGMYHKWEKRQSLEAQMRKERAKISPDIRYDVLARDGFRCRICGLSAEEGAVLEVDHIIPVICKLCVEIAMPEKVINFQMIYC